MNFHGWCYPLEAYFQAFEQARLPVENLRESGALPAVEDDPAYECWRRLPLFLHMRAVKI